MLVHCAQSSDSDVADAVAAAAMLERESNRKYCIELRLTGERTVGSEEEGGVYRSRSSKYIQN